MPSLVMTHLLTMGQSAVGMVSRPGEVAVPGAVMSPAALQNSSTGHTLDPHDQGCENGALMDSFGIFLQGLIGVVAFSLLLCEYNLSFSYSVFQEFIHTRCVSHELYCHY